MVPHSTAELWSSSPQGTGDAQHPQGFKGRQDKINPCLRSIIWLGKSSELERDGGCKGLRRMRCTSLPCSSSSLCICFDGGGERGGGDGGGDRGGRQGGRQGGRGRLGSRQHHPQLHQYGGVTHTLAADSPRHKNSLQKPQIGSDVQQHCFPQTLSGAGIRRFFSPEPTFFVTSRRCQNKACTSLFR